MTNVWPGGQTFGIWAVAIGTRFAPIPNAANRRPAPKSEKSAADFRYITPLPIERPRQPERTDRQNQLGSDHTTPGRQHEPAPHRRVERKERPILSLSDGFGRL